LGNPTAGGHYRNPASLASHGQISGNGLAQKKPMPFYSSF